MKLAVSSVDRAPARRRTDGHLNSYSGKIREEIR
jgi:hypothetical protein